MSSNVGEITAERSLTFNERRRIVTKDRLQEMIERRLTVPEMALELGVSQRSIDRGLIHFGFREPVKHGIDLPMDRIALLTVEGMPATWIAEDYGVNASTIRERVADMPGVEERNREWKIVWAQISHHPHLMTLHREFAPKRGDLAAA